MRIPIEFPSKMTYHLIGEIFHGSIFDVIILPSNANNITDPLDNYFFMK